MTIVKPDGMVGLLTPSGIASDKTAARFFKGVSTQGRLRALYDFENKKVFFPDVHASFKFCVFVASPSPVKDPARCAFYLHNVAELDDPERCFPLTAADFACVNPNTGTAPIFRTRRDAELTTAIYGRLPVLVDRSSGGEVKAWPVKYTTHVRHDQRLRPVPYARRTRGAGRSLSHRQKPLRQSIRRLGATLRRQDGTGVRSSRCQRSRQPREPAPARSACTGHPGAAPGMPDWLPDPQFLVLPLRKLRFRARRIRLGSWIQGHVTASTNAPDIYRCTDSRQSDSVTKCRILKLGSNERHSSEWLLAGNLNANLNSVPTSITSCARRFKVKTLNLVHHRATPRRSTQSLHDMSVSVRRLPARSFDEAVSGTHLHRPRHGAVCRGYGPCR